MKGAKKSDKKRVISWGVSFGSLALVAGMVSYFGLSNGQTVSKNTQFPTQSDFSSQHRYHQEYGNGSSSDNFGDNGNSIYDNGSSNDFGGNDPLFNNNDGSYGNQDGFDTTTGGT